MSAESGKPANPIRATNPEAIRQAKTLMRTARYGALAVFEPQSGYPFSSRVATATAADGAPLILISRLSGHTKGLLADNRCSILLGEPGKGDPLAHPRITVQCRARFLDDGDEQSGLNMHRYLRRNPKAKLYAGFADFSLVRLEPEWASLNGGFGQAFRLDRHELVDDQTMSDCIAKVELSVLEYLTGNRNQELNKFVSVNGYTLGRPVRLTGIDSTGMDLMSAQSNARLWFVRPAKDAASLMDAIKSAKMGA